MRLNRELRTPKNKFHAHILWVIFYVVLLLGIFAVGYYIYNEHNEDRLPSGYIELITSKEKYQLGEEIEFTVYNHFPTTIYVTNQCPQEPLYVYKWENEQWVQIHDTANDSESECYEQPRNVPISANTGLSYSFKDWPNLFKDPGVYRVVMVIDHYNDLPYQDFVVLKPAQVIETPLPGANVPAPIQQQQEQNEDHEEEHDEPQEIEIENE